MHWAQVGVAGCSVLLKINPLDFHPKRTISWLCKYPFVNMTVMTCRLWLQPQNPAVWDGLTAH